MEHNTSNMSLNQLLNLDGQSVKKHFKKVKKTKAHPLSQMDLISNPTKSKQQV